MNLAIKYTKKNAPAYDDITKDFVLGMIKKSEKAFDTARAAAQYAAVCIIVLAAKHPKDAVEMANLHVNSMGDGVKGEGMVKYLQDLGGFKFGADPKEGFKDVKNEEWIRANLQAAKDKGWWTYAPKAPFKGFDLNEEITRVLKRAEGMADKTGKEAELVHVDVAMLRTMRALLGGSPIQGDDALALVQKLVPSNVLEFPSVAAKEKDAPVLDAEKSVATK